MIARQRDAGLAAFRHLRRIEDAYVKIEAGNLMSFKAEAAEIFAAHHLGRFQYIFSAERFFKRCAKPRGERRVIECRWIPFAELYNRREMGRDARSQRDSFDNALNRLKHLL